MSGGHYEYNNFQMNNIAEIINNDIETNSSMNWNMSDQTIERMKIISHLLQVTSQLTYLADYLYSGDSGEDTFNRRFDEVCPSEFKNLNNES
jgi:hypothetical protein